MADYSDAPRGANHYKSKLTESQAIRIRREYREKQAEIKEMIEEFSMQAYADHYGVSKRTIESLLSGRTWKHV